MVTKNGILSLVMLVCVLQITACGGTVDSDNLKTESIQATIAITGKTGETRVSAELLSIGPDGALVALVSDDSFTVDAYGESKILTRYGPLYTNDNYNAVYYQNNADELITVILARADERDAPNSYVRLPAPVNIYSHQERSSESAIDPDENVTVLWDVSTNSHIDVEARYACSDTSGLPIDNTHTESFGDTGSYTFSFIQLLTAEVLTQIDTNIPCSVSVRVKRTATGVMDTAFYSGSSITAEQSAAVRFTVNM